MSNTREVGFRRTLGCGILGGFVGGLVCLALACIAWGKLGPESMSLLGALTTIVAIGSMLLGVLPACFFVSIIGAALLRLGRYTVVLGSCSVLGIGLAFGAYWADGLSKGPVILPLTAGVPLLFSWLMGALLRDGGRG